VTVSDAEFSRRPYRWGARTAGLAGLSATAAVIAHAGPAGLRDARLLAVALAGAAVAAAWLMIAACVSVDARRRTARLADGRAIAVERVERIQPIPLPVVVAAAVVCQEAGHIALMVAGVAMARDEAGTLALHLGFAIVVAVIWSATDRIVCRIGGRLVSAVERWLELLLGLAAPLPAALCPAPPAGARPPGSDPARGPPRIV
jgi:hypothetical protein